jgi:short-subunit dehydrogenase
MSEFRGWGGAAVVTGASAGIGRELARALAGRGFDLVLVARSEEPLRLLAAELAQEHGVRAEAIPVNLADGNGVHDLVEAMDEQGLVPDLLVNNAGFGIYGPFGNLGPEREVEMVRLNVAAPVELTARLLPGMRARGRGVILNVASTAAFAPVPWLGAYGATKSFILQWTHALAEELRGTGVRAAVLCPGSTETDFHDVSGAARRQRHHLPRQTARAVAAEALRGLDRGQRVIVTGWINRLHVRSARLLPMSWAARLAAPVMRPRR